MEINENITYKDIEDSYMLQHKIHYTNYASERMKRATEKLTEQNIKRTINKLHKELALSNPECSSFKPYITAYDRKQFFGKLYRIYRENHKRGRIELLPPVIEVPKVKIKK